MRFGSQSNSTHNTNDKQNDPLIFVQYGVPKTPRERETEASQIRSYASKNAYQARKVISRPKNFPPPSQYPTIRTTQWTPEPIVRSHKSTTHRFRIQTPRKDSSDTKNEGILRQRSQIEEFQHLVPSPRSIVSQKASDLFFTTDTFAPNILNNRNTHDYTRILWPGLRSEELHYSAHGHSILSCMGRSTMLMSAMLFSAAVHRDTLRDAGRLTAESDDRRRFYYKGQAMAMVRAKLSESVWLPNVLDDLILSTFFLAVSEGATDTYLALPDPSAFTPPLATTQWIRLYGLQTIDLRHWRAVVALIEKRDGLRNMSLHGAAWAISLASLMLGATTLAVPQYPPTDSDGQESVYVAPLLQLDPIPPAAHSLNPAHGFHYLATIGVRQDLLQIFLNFSELAQALHVYSTQQRSQLQTNQLIDCRNIVAYKILTLLNVERSQISQEHPTDNHSIAESSKIWNLFQLLRLTVILFTLQVIYPLPRITTIRSSLLSQLQDVLHTCDSPSANVEEQEIMLWCAFIGAISAEADSLVSGKWFAAHVAKSSVMLSIDNYAQLRHLMRQFAWVDTACDDSAQRIWKKLIPR